ncbi:GNAT family N-acetyltransferase [Salinispirillum marinum]|uniref:GNAT family N-acetyltransferase n=2 Tax=Saccharospirillaceae TaxID=255527 RepID=A0ABV8BKR8_9GAMM
MSTRPAQRQDITAIYRALSSVIAEQHYLMSAHKPDLPHFSRFLEANLERGYPVLVAEEGRHVVGWCDVYPRGPDVQRHVGRLGMGVVAHFRGRGHGKQLLTEAIAASWRAGFTRLELEVFADNPVAIALYERAGFQREGLHRRVRKDSKGYRDMISMALLAL